MTRRDNCEKFGLCKTSVKMQAGRLGEAKFLHLHKMFT